MISFFGYNYPLHSSRYLSQSKYHGRISGANGELWSRPLMIPLERAINGTPGVKYIASDAGNDGEASIQVVFYSGIDPNVVSSWIFRTVLFVVKQAAADSGAGRCEDHPWRIKHADVPEPPVQHRSIMDEKFLYNFADINLLSELKSVDGVGFWQMCSATVNMPCVSGWSRTGCWPIKFLQMKY